MEISKELSVREIIGMGKIGVGRKGKKQIMKIVFVLPAWYNGKENSFMELDEDSCDHFGIPMSLDLAGRIFVCKLQTQDLPLKAINENIEIDTKGVKENRMLIIKWLKKEELQVPDVELPMNFPKGENISCFIKLSSIQGYPFYPNYQLILDLSMEEHNICRELLKKSAFSLEKLEKI